MSHAPQRKEKDCLNCGTTVLGHYCQNCGQENVIPHETFWHMFTHFFYDITHFDGSFFVTVKDLLFKPGFLTKEYMRGRRKAYLHPVRMYVFTSAVFFLVFFAMFSVKESDVHIVAEKPELVAAAKEQKEDELKKARQDDPAGQAKTQEDSMRILNASGLARLSDSLAKNKKDSVGKVKRRINSGPVGVSFGGAQNYKTIKEYDSLQNALPKHKRDGWFLKLITRKLIVINEKYKGRENELMAEVINKFMHNFPYFLFVSLPLYALFLKFLYIRRKQFYFADHGVFLIHLYIFTFLFMLLYFGLDKLEDKTGWGGIGITRVLLILTGLFYTLKAMRNFYEQGWRKTSMKFLFFNLLCLITAVFLFAVFFLFSFYQI